MNCTATACGVKLGVRNISGLCRSCLAKRNNSLPEVVARRKAAIHARFADPAVMQAHCDRLAAYMANMPEDERARRSENGKRLYRDVLCRPEVVARREAARLAPDALKRRGLRLSDTMLPWCPREHRPLYRELRAMGETIANARAVVEGEIARLAEAAERERLRPRTFAEQLELARAGALVVDRIAMPSRVHAFTLGGVAPEAL